jgi:hypothetical protein
MIQPDTLLIRQQVAERLNEHGFPIKQTSLETMASRGGGPPFRKFGSKPLYRWGDVLEWANNRLGPLVNSTSAKDAISRPAKAAPSAREAV